MKSKRFSNSFRPIVELKEGEMCSWRRHYRGALRNLIGILNLWASNDPDRFVYAGLEAIVKSCKRYKGKGYSRSAVLAALRELRSRQHIVTIDGEKKRFTIVTNLVECTRFGYKSSGFSVAAHDTLCVREGNKCVFRTDAPLVWNSTPENVLQNALPSAQQSALQNVQESARQSALPSVLPSSPQNDESKKVTSKNAPLTALTASAALSIQTNQTNPTALPAQTSATKNRSGMDWNGLEGASLGVEKQQQKQQQEEFTAEENKLWEEMRYHDDFPEEMLTAVPYEGDQRAVINQINNLVKRFGREKALDVFVEALDNWADNRDKGLDGLFARWKAWLREGGPLLRKVAVNSE